MRNSNKNRYFDSVNHRQQKDVCFFEFEIDFIPIRKILKRDVDPLPSYLLKMDDYADLIKKIGMDMAFLQVPWRLGRDKNVDKEGRTIYSEGRIRDFSELREIKYPSLDNIKRRIEEALDALKDTNVGIIYGLELNTILVYKAMRYEDYYFYMIDNSEFIKEFQKKLEDYVYKQVEIIFEYPIDAVRIDSNLCMNNGPIISKELMEEFELPSVRKIVDIIHKNNMIVELHTDGYIESLIPEFIEMGIDVLNPIDTCGGVQDIYRIKKEFGKDITLHGNIDVGGVLTFGDEQEVRNDTKKHIDILSEGGGYILGSSHDIHQDISVPNFMAMIETVHDHKIMNIE